MEIFYNPTQFVWHLVPRGCLINKLHKLINMDRGMEREKMKNYRKLDNACTELT